MCSNLAELPSYEFEKATLGPWRSPVAHLHGMQGVRGSNPLGSTEIRVQTAIPKPQSEDLGWPFDIYSTLHRTVPFALG